MRELNETELGHIGGGYIIGTVTMGPLASLLAEALKQMQEEQQSEQTS